MTKHAPNEKKPVFVDNLKNVYTTTPKPPKKM